jgi:glycosyltransferase involved in cell wall biosynthesis/phosphoribosylaminoimidazole carboxylase (NCAIR synthetase)
LRARHMEQPIDISVIVPVYRGKCCIQRLFLRLFPVLQDIGSYEVIFVDDGSRDKTADEIRRLSALFPGVWGLVLSRNRGQQRASEIGLRRARGRVVATMDDDLQHRPEDLPRLLRRLESEGGLETEEGPVCDLVFGLPEDEGREKRSFLRGAGSSLRDHMFRWIAAGKSGGESKVRPTSFRVMRRELLQRFCADPRPVFYLSAGLLRHARSVSHVRIPRGGETGHPGRYSLKKLAAALFGLLLSLPKTPAFLTKLFAPKEEGGITEIEESRASGRKLFIVGAGEGQLYGLRYAAARGFTLGVGDADPAAPGRRHADFFKRADTFDAGATTEAARTFGAEGLCTYGTDQPVLTVAKAAAALSLPGPLPVETALAATNKGVMKPLFEKHGIPTCPYRLIDKGAKAAGWNRENRAEGLRKPLVLKPVDSQGQRGVVRAENEDEVRTFLPGTLLFSREGRAVLEEYYQGGEVTFSGWVVDGTLYPLTLTDRITVHHGPHIGVCISHNYPSRYFSEYGEQVLDISRRIAASFGIKEGPVYFQMLIGEEGVKVNEIACRIGGAYEDEIIPLLTGVDILGLAFDEALDGRPGEKTFRRLRDFCYPAQGASSVLLFFTRALRVEGTGDMNEILRLSGVYGGRYLLHPGRKVGEMKNSTGRAGYVIIHGEDTAMVNERIADVYRRLAVYDAKGRNGIIDYTKESLHRL